MLRSRARISRSVSGVSWSALETVTGLTQLHASVATELAAQLLINGSIRQASNASAGLMGVLYILEGGLKVSVLLGLNARLTDGEEGSEGA